MNRGTDDFREEDQPAILPTAGKLMSASQQCTKVLRSVALLISLVLAGCGDNSVPSIFFTDVNGFTPAGVPYSGRKCTLLDAGTEYYAVVIVAQGDTIKIVSSSATGMSVRLASNKEVEAVFGQSVTVAGPETETLRNGSDFEATVDVLEKALDRLSALDVDESNPIKENRKTADSIQ